MGVKLLSFPYTRIIMDDDNKLVNDQFDELLQQCNRICKTEGDYDRIRQAFYFARDAHSGVKRKSGEPYITHPIAVARIVVAEIGLGIKSVQAALLHDVVEDTDYTLEDISFRFGANVAKLVDGLTKLSGVFDNNSSEQAENFKRMLLTLSDDVRVIIIKLADRLHNMRTLGSMLPHKQMKIASETIYLFAPLAHRLGLYSIKSELEDLSLKFRFATEYEDIEERLEVIKANKDEFIEKFTAPIIKKFNSRGVNFKITARFKSVYSIWKKMKSKQVGFDEIYDLFAIRIVFEPKDIENEKAECWQLYSDVADIYHSKMDRLRNWIHTPKANGYEALHCTVMSNSGVWVEVQIRTERMDAIAERGFAAHWAYKDRSGTDSDIDPMLEQLRQALSSPVEDAVDFLDNFKLGLTVQDIIVFTPKGDSKEMPKGSTALDFAYEIHSKVGNSAIGAKINYKLMPIYTEITSGDQIEIITSPSVAPKAAWLDHANTAKAKYHIKQALKKENSNNVPIGYKIFENKMRELGIKIQARVFRKVLPAYGCANKNEFYSKLGAGIIELGDIEKVLKTNAAEKLIKYWSLQLTSPFRNSKSDAQQYESDKDGKNMVMAECCNPIPGDEVVGFEREDGVVEVHRKLCPKAVHLSSLYGDKIVAATWSSEKILSYLAIVEMRGIDRIGILLDVSKIVSELLDVNIREVSFSSHDGIFEGYISLYVQSNDDLVNLMDKVGEVKGIEKIYRRENESVN